MRFRNIIAVCLGFLVMQVQAADGSLPQAIEQKLAYLQQHPGAEVAGFELAAVEPMAALYKNRNYAPLWTDEQRMESLLQAIELAISEGLNPDDYAYFRVSDAYVSTIEGDNLTQQERLQLELLLTESLMRLIMHLRFGKVNPENHDTNWNFGRRLLQKDPLKRIQKAVESANLPGIAKQALPRGPHYLRLKDALAQYRAYQQQGGWPTVSAGNTLRSGDQHYRVVELKQRLIATGELGSGNAETPLFDEALEQAVKRFQLRHNLEADGLVGAKTIDQMNVPVEARIQQIKVNLERARWVFDSLEEDFVLVNIAAFEVYLVKNGELVWRTRAQVGRDYRQTPVFKSMMTYLQFNPTWTVPPTILREDIIPKVKSDPGYLSRKNLQVFSADGKLVDPASVDWAALNANGAPYRYVQTPGPHNVLGRIKFMFPNEHYVFIHDTPSRTQFDRNVRTFSSGCIRIEDPIGFTQRLLADKAWDQGKIEKALASERTFNEKLKKPIRVFMLYFTAFVTDDGVMQFYDDIYNRDAVIAQALDEKAVFDFNPVIQ